MPSCGPQRLAVLLHHLTPPREALHQKNDDQLEVVPTSMLASTLPMLALGAVAWYQSRRQASESQNQDRNLSQLDVVAEELGFDAERLQQVKEWAGKHGAASKLPGIVLAVARRGRIVFHEAIGDGYIRDSIMSVQVMPIITAAFLSLVDEGRAGVHDEVVKYIPSFAQFSVYRSGKTRETLKTDPLNTPITVFHLLTHTWGFPGTVPSTSSQPELRLLDEMARARSQPRVGHDSDFEKLTEVPLIDQPGKRYRVGLASAVVGHIICRITGKSLPEVFQERITGPLGMVDTAWGVASDKQHRIASTHHAAPWLTNRLWGNYLTGEHAGHTSWLGWVAKPAARHTVDEQPQDISENTEFYSTALDQLSFHSMLLNHGLATSGQRVLTPESVFFMTCDQLPVLATSLGDAEFNSHAKDRAGSGGLSSPYFGVDAGGQGLGLGMQVVNRPVKSRLAGSKGTFSAWSICGTECWSDPALEMSVFIGSQLTPFWAHPDMRQEIAGLVYGALVSTAAAKHFVNGQAVDATGGWAGQLMNVMMMMSMFGGSSMMGGLQPQPGNAAPGPT
eukprot:TRINITY_DN89929_c0_g1_i1.p1 TRINITY_DN89929_c0_g1~~TRINITY_DN89929_c0_g1_i1.p1  ORF type:complete len:562 (-),score=101.38 TRINITY_DN89929_c0_g1_i1:110-1795(-)